jgi:hypothetical protein
MVMKKKRTMWTFRSLRLKHELSWYERVEIQYTQYLKCERE